jgi:hypothetical protein
MVLWKAGVASVTGVTNEFCGLFHYVLKYSWNLQTDYLTKRNPTQDDNPFDV